MTYTVFIFIVVDFSWTHLDPCSFGENFFWWKSIFGENLFLGENMFYLVTTGFLVKLFFCLVKKLFFVKTCFLWKHIFGENMFLPKTFLVKVSYLGKFFLFVCWENVFLFSENLFFGDNTCFCKKKRWKLVFFNLFFVGWKLVFGKSNLCIFLFVVKTCFFGENMVFLFSYFFYSSYFLHFSYFF